MKTKIVHSIIADTQQEIDNHIRHMGKICKIYQLDIMDGKFVKNKSCMFDFELPKGKIFEAHLMIDDPVSWIIKYLDKVDVVIVHFEAMKDFSEIYKLVKWKGKKLGLAINPDTPVASIKPYLEHIDQVLVMSVYPGQYGGEFLPRTLSKVGALRDLKKDLIIEVDGGMNPTTIPMAKDSGANLIVVGGFLEKSSHPSHAFRELQKLV